jgi:hypothetical protein
VLEQAGSFISAAFWPFVAVVGMVTLARIADALEQISRK